MQNIKIPKNVSKPWLKKIQLTNPVTVSIMYCFLFSFRNQIKLSFMSFEGFENDSSQVYTDHDFWYRYRPE